MFHDRLGQQHRILHRARAGHRAGTAGMAFHDRGIQLVAAFGVEHSALAGVEQRRILHHPHRGDHRLARAAAALQHGVAGVERLIERGLVFGLLGRRQVLAGDDPGAAMDDQGGARRFGGDGCGGESEGEDGGFHGRAPVAFRHDTQSGHGQPWWRSASIGSSCEALRAG